ncbi:MAG TPA: zf-HC2 domain-containing protein [Pyrinomonadaceae bacterium]|nr:zf-HC2 domain-containing protein [Pyrinomonadaceae bacterium]
MREMCFDEAVLQSYSDGELSPETMQSVAAHINTCADCAETAKEIESETELMRVALAHEMGLSVPTESLRSRIDAAIRAEQYGMQAVEVREESKLRTWFAGLMSSFNLSPQQVIGFASLVVVVTFAAIFAAIKLQHGTPGVSTSTGEQAAINRSNQQVAVPQSSTTQNAGEVNPTPAPIDDGGAVTPTQQVAVSVRRKMRPPFGGRMVNTEYVRPDVQQQPDPPPLPDEQGYLRAIASLTRAVNSTGNSSLPPSVQAEYRRNLALIDQAIAATRLSARRNPQDASARQFLYASYQNKVDLLSAVADQTMLVASR